MIDIPHPISWPDSSDELGQALRITHGPSLQCHGVTAKHTKCKLPISKASVAEIDSLLGQIARQSSFGSAETQLKTLAPLLLCKRFHRNQAPSLLRTWEEELASASSRQRGKGSDYSKVKKENAVSDSLHTSSEKQPNLKSGNSGTKVKTEGEDTKEPIYRSPRTNAAASPRPEPKVTPPRRCKHNFEPFDSRSTLEINKSIKKKILQSLLPTERPGSTEGFIYIYTFPEEYRVRAPPLKIGYSKDVDKRMRDWHAQCGYMPKVLSTTGAELYVKVEKLVHEQLWNQRRCEVNCPGCSKNHKEWFQVKRTRAAGVVSLWADWSRVEPYDEQGHLKEEWRKRLAGVDLEKKTCWEQFVNEDDEGDE